MKKGRKKGDRVGFYSRIIHIYMYIFIDTYVFAYLAHPPPRPSSKKLYDFICSVMFRLYGLYGSVARATVTTRY